jgi:zinc transport system permease protein
MVIPVSSALQFGRGFKQSIYLSVLFSLISVIIGLFASYAFGLASGGTIVMTAILIFILSIFLNKK